MYYLQGEFIMYLMLILMTLELLILVLTLFTLKLIKQRLGENKWN